MRDLTIICLGDPANALTGTPADDGTGCIVLTTQDLTRDEEDGPTEGAPVDIMLDKERARMLFNWLAVFLHS